MNHPKIQFSQNINKQMDRYKILKSIGDGTFGTVSKGINKQTNEIVAIKKMKKKFFSWEEAMSLREVKSLRKLSHPNIVKLKEVVRADDDLYFIFEFMGDNMYEMMKNNAKSLTEDKLKNTLY